MKNLLDRVRLFFCKDKESYLLLYELLGFFPGNLKPYKLALTHSSQATGKHKKLASNERLEFLGDAVLSSVTADYLYRIYGKEREGFLSKSRSRLVCRENLNSVALKIGLDKFLYVPEVGHQHNTYVYGNAFEALVGAIYIDKGYEQCQRFLLERFLCDRQAVDAIVQSDCNYKSRLIEWGQKEHRKVTFVLKSEQLRNDGPYFISEVLVDDIVCGEGDGFSKRESQQNAARMALVAVADAIDGLGNSSSADRT